MIKSKVFEILNSFTKDEFKRFSDFVSSPYFNKKEALVKLTQVYRDQHPDFDNEEFTKENVFSFVFPDKKYNDEVFRNLNSDLMRLGESFLSQTNFSSDAFLTKKHLLSEISKRKLYSLFERSFEDAAKTIDSYNHKDIKYLHDMYELYLEKDIFNGFSLKFSKEDILEAEKYLVKYFAVRIAEIQSYLLYQYRILRIEETLILDDKFIDSFLKEIPSEISETKQLQIYYNELKLERTLNEKYYFKLKELLLNNGDLLEKENLYNKYSALENFIQRTKPQNDLSAITELFRLRQIILENNLHPSNFISNNLFLNLVKSGIILKEFDWVKSFIKKYSSIIVSSFRQSTKELSLALLSFADKDYDTSLMHLSKVKYENSFYNLNIKNLTSRIYYEKNDFMTLIGILNAYKSYLSTNKTVTEKEILTHNLFITNLLRLVKIKEEKKYNRIEVAEESTNKNDFPSKIWMQEKINELYEEEENKV